MLKNKSSSRSEGPEIIRPWLFGQEITRFCKEFRIGVGVVPNTKKIIINFLKFSSPKSFSTKVPIFLTSLHLQCMEWATMVSSGEEISTTGQFGLEELTFSPTRPLWENSTVNSELRPCLFGRPFLRGWLKILTTAILPWPSMRGTIVDSTLLKAIWVNTWELPLISRWRHTKVDFFKPMQSNWQ